MCTTLTFPQRWEQKVVESNVAEFEPGPPTVAATSAGPVPPQALPQLAPPPPAGQYNLAVPQPRATPVKSEVPETPQASYSLPTLPQLQAPPPRPLSAQQMQQLLTPQHIQSLQQHHRQQQMLQQQLMQQQQQPKASPSALQATTRLPQLDGPSRIPQLDGPSRIPQLDGPSSASSSSSSRSSQSPPPPLHTNPSLVPPIPSTSGVAVGDEEIGSDLDDDDSEGEDDEAAAGIGAADGGASGDIVYCTYDKVRDWYTFQTPS